MDVSGILEEEEKTEKKSINQEVHAQTGQVSAIGLIEIDRRAMRKQERR